MKSGQKKAKLLIGVNDIKSCNPQKAEWWDYDKNGDAVPENFLGSSGKKMWWICMRGHSFFSPIRNQIIRNYGCPVCSNKALYKGINDLETMFPDLMQEWDWDKNDIPPSKYSVHSSKKVYWKCSKGHSYYMGIGHRTGSQHQGCPYCASKKIIVGENDFASLYPDLVEEWDFEKNKLKPTEVFPHSNKKVYWKCPKGHSYYMGIGHRTGSQHQGCPYCANKKIIVGENDFAFLRPDLLIEWDYDKNMFMPTEVSLGSKKKIFWKCKVCGNAWKACVVDRVHGSGCPKCYYRNQTSFPEQALYYYIRQTYADAINKCRTILGDKRELDIYIPSERIAIEYDGVAFHMSSDAYEREIKKYNECKKQGITLIRVKEYEDYINSDTADFVIGSLYHKDSNSLNTVFELLRNYIKLPANIDVDRDRELIKEQYINIVVDNCLEDSFPELAREWHPVKNGTLTPKFFTAYSKEKVWWLCGKCKASWEATIDNRSRGNGCPYCSGRFAVIGKTDLLSQNSKVAKEWNWTRNGSLTPQDVTANSNKKVWWKCEKGHEWQAKIESRNQGDSCPFCGNRSVLAGFNDLKLNNEELSKEWHSTKNGVLTASDFLYTSSKSVWWRGKCGHEWKATIYSRNIKSTGCPYCAGVKVLKGFNDLATKYPDYLKEWNYAKNGDLQPSEVSAHSHKKVWWIAECGHEWEAEITSRIDKKYGCPYCSGRRVLAGFNDLKTINPVLADEWDYMNNEGAQPDMYTAGSKKMIMWKCSVCGHSWRARIGNRNRGEGCPNCRKK